MSLHVRIAAHIDKVQHFGVGLAMQLILRFVHPAAGLLAVSAAAWLKEDRDRRDPAHHTKDGWDAYATLLGAVAAEVLALLITITFGVHAPTLL